MSLIQHTETLPGSTEDLFDLTQDYARRAAWDPFPESYEFHDGASYARMGVQLTVRARNGYRMKVKYVSFNRPHAAAIEMVAGPWFIERFAGAWSFVPEAKGCTRVNFKYNIVAGPGAVGWLLQPLIDWSFTRHTKKRLRGLKAYVERTEFRA